MGFRADWKEQSRGSWGSNFADGSTFRKAAGFRDILKMGCLMRIADALEGANKIASEQLELSRQILKTQKRTDRRLAKLAKLEGGRPKE